MRSHRLLLVVCLSLTPFLPASAAPAGPADHAVAGYPYAEHVTVASERFGIPKTWIWEIMRVESRGNPSAVSPAGAMGLMQIMPRTWAMLTARYALGKNPFDIAANINAGAAYLREMLDRYGDLASALAAYNAGPGRVDDWHKRGRPLPPETIAYVARIAPRGNAVGDTSSATVQVPAVQSWRNAAVFAVRTYAQSPSVNATERDPSSLGSKSGISASSTPSVASSPSRGNGLFVSISGGSER